MGRDAGQHLQRDAMEGVKLVEFMDDFETRYGNRKSFEKGRSYVGRGAVLLKEERRL